MIAWNAASQVGALAVAVVLGEVEWFSAASSATQAIGVGTEGD